MRRLALAAAVTAFAILPAHADDRPADRPVALKADQVGRIFCLSRLGDDAAAISGLLTDSLAAAVAAVRQLDADDAARHPGDKPPLGDGIPWQSAADAADTCDVGLVTLSRTDARVEIDYGFTGNPDAGFTDTLILKRIGAAGADPGRWRIDDVIYPDETDLKAALAGAVDAG